MSPRKLHRAVEVVHKTAVPGSTITPGTNEQQAVPLTEIGTGKPLSLKIRSIFPGSAGWHDRERVGGTLVTSAVKNPIMNDAAPMALHYYFKDAPAGEALIPSPAGGGSSVVYYSPGMIHSSVDIEVRMAFDRFDPAKLEVWTDAIGKASDLPIFAAMGVGGAAAMVYAASNVVKFASRAFDGWFDDDEDWISTWTLPIDEAGLVPAKAAYVLFYGDREPEQVQGPGGSIIASEFDYRGKQFIVDQRTGTLRYKDEPERQVLEGDPYVLAIVNGAEQPALKKWAPSAVSAILYQRFFGAENNGGAGDLLEIVEAFNDIMMAKQISELDAALKKLPAEERKDSDLQKKRDGALKNIQDEKIAEMLKK